MSSEPTKERAEIGADTTRSQRPLACVVLGLTQEAGEQGPARQPDLGGSTGSPGVTPGLGEILAVSTRSSDAIGRVGDSDFVILAPGTDEAGALRLAGRVIDTVEDGVVRHSDRIELNAGLHTVSGPELDSSTPRELVRRATVALRLAQSSSEGNEGSRIRLFERS